MVRDYLQFCGYLTVGACDGQQALTLLTDSRPCLILLDLTMPVMDGWRFREEQRRLADPELANVPILILSALPDVDVQARALGAVGVIRKPVNLQHMLAVVRTHCGDASRD
jgi:CheY-like chemotaxis protein